MSSFNFPENPMTVAASYSIQGDDSDSEVTEIATPLKSDSKHLTDQFHTPKYHNDHLSQLDQWHTPAEVLVRAVPTSTSSEMTKTPRRKLYEEEKLHNLAASDFPAMGGLVHSTKARSSSDPESRHILEDVERTPTTWSSRTRHRHSRCSITPQPINRNISSLNSDGATDSTDSHCHSNLKKSGFDKKARTKLIVASILCLLFMTGEMVGGLLAHSLAIISDAAHLLTDFASFMISLMALYLAHRPATKKFSFGWYRIEILGAFLSILMLWVLTGILVYSAVLRIMENTYEIDAEIMLITAATGVAFNILLGTTLHQHSHSHGGHSHGGGGGGHSHGAGGGGHSHGEGEDHSHDEEECDNSHSGVHGHEEVDFAHGHSHNGCIDHDHFSGQSHSSHASSHSHQAVVAVSSVTQGARSAYGSLDDVERGEPSERTPLIKAKATKSHRKKESNINVKAAFIHVIGDLLQSVGVLVAAFIIYYKPEWKIADPICTFMFSLFVLVTTFTIMKDIIVVLMEGTPRGINLAEVSQALCQVEGVLDIHNLRVWSLTMDKIALSVHLAIDKKSDPHKVLKLASLTIQEKFNISETTMQVELFIDEMIDCQDCQGPKL